MKLLFVLFVVSAQFALGQNSAVEILSSDLDKFQNIRDFCLSKDGSEVYFSIQSPNQELSQIVVVRNGDYSNPELLPFCDEYMYLEPFLAPDNLRLYFASNRPKTTESKEKSDYDIWYVERSDLKSTWSEPINLGAPVNSEEDEFYPTLSANNNLYFTKASSKGLGNDDIYFCEWKGKKFSKPELLSESVNSVGYEFNAFISPDESFLLYTKYGASDGFGSGDLYVSRRSKNGNWLPAENLGAKINSKQMEYCPFYDVESKTLYFTSRRSELKPKKFQNLEEYQTYISSSENGFSKLYKVQFDIRQ